MHPAAEWAATQNFDSMAVDCTTTVVLKILDGKCKMLPGEKAAIFEIYDVLESDKGKIFNDRIHQEIAAARVIYSKASTLDGQLGKRIHELRVYAESEIPKPTMKAYKAVLRDGLFG